MTGTDEVLDPQMPSEQPDPRDIARAVAMDVADEPEQVGDVVNAIELVHGYPVAWIEAIA